MVTSRLDDVGGRADEGSAWVFRRNAAGLYEPATQIFSTLQQADQWFGFSVAAEGGVVVVGSPFANAGGEFNIGLDFSSGLLGSCTWGVLGYLPEYSEAVARNLVLTTAAAAVK